MKPQDSAPMLAALAPAAVIAPPVIILGVIVVAGLLWLLSGDDGDTETKPEAMCPTKTLAIEWRG